MLAYLALHLAYSFWLKNLVIIDVFAIAAGFVLRLVAGVVVIDITNFSPWLYVCMGLLALFLAVGKRRQELLLLEDAAQNHRTTYKDYNLPLLDNMLQLVMTSTVLTYMLYTIEAETVRANGHRMLLTIPFVLYGIFRYMYLIHVRGEGSAPDELLFKDLTLLATVILYGMFVGVILYFVRFYLILLELLCNPLPAKSFCLANMPLSTVSPPLLFHCKRFRLWLRRRSRRPAVV